MCLVPNKLRKKDFFRKNSYILLHIVALLSVIICTSYLYILFIIIFHNFKYFYGCYFQKFSIVMNKLNQVDDTLEELGTSKEYRAMRNSIKWILVMWFIIICTSLTTDSLTFMEMFNDTNCLIIPIVLNYSFYINILINIIFMFLLRFV